MKNERKELGIEPNFQKALGNIGHVYEMMEEYELAIEFMKNHLMIKVKMRT